MSKVTLYGGPFDGRIEDWPSARDEIRIPELADFNMVSKAKARVSPYDMVPIKVPPVCHVYKRSKTNPNTFWYSGSVEG